MNGEILGPEESVNLQVDVYCHNKFLIKNLVKCSQNAAGKIVDVDECIYKKIMN